MKYRVAKPLRYFHIGSEMDIDPNTKLHARLISEGVLEPVKKPKAPKRETKPAPEQGIEVKDDRQND